MRKTHAKLDIKVSAFTDTVSLWIHRLMARYLHRHGHCIPYTAYPQAYPQILVRVDIMDLIRHIIRIDVDTL